MELGCPWFIDQVDDGFVIWILGGGEDTCGLVEKDDAASVGLEHVTGGNEVIEFAQRCGSVRDRIAVKDDLAVF